MGERRGVRKQRVIECGSWVLRIDIQRGNWSRGKEESIGNWLKLGNQVREAKHSSCYCLIMFKSRFQSDLWDGEIVKFTFGLNYLCRGSFFLFYCFLRNEAESWLFFFFMLNYVWNFEVGHRFMIHFRVWLCWVSFCNLWTNRWTLITITVIRVQNLIL